MTNPNGRFGIHGGQYIPETLMNAVKELEEAYNHYKNDPEFNRELTELLNDYAGRPSRLYYAEKMTKDLGGAKIYLKREDLNHTGAHKINNVLGQALLAKKMGKTRLIAETGAGQHGVATATAADPYGYGMCCIHGRGGHKASGAQCIPHASARSRGYPGYIRHSHVKGCRIGGNERVDQENFGHTLLPGLSYGTTPVPYHRKRFPGGHLKGNQGADA